MELDQTAPKFILFAIYATKVHKQMREHTICEWLGKD